ncbi:MAG TPA: hypothetical protein VN200_00260 [Rhodoglobus sp.]|nr:hypothetical protein [Rhodoglobus sp.]
MMGRVLEAGATLAGGVVLAYLLAVVLQVLLGGDLLGAAILVFWFGGVGIAGWGVVLLIGAVNGRGLGYGTLGAILAAVVASVTNLVAVIIVAMLSGGADVFAIALGLMASVVLLIGATVSVLVLRRMPWVRGPGARAP